MFNVGPLNEIADVISGYAFKSAWFGGGGDRVIRISDIQDNLINSDKAVTFDSKVNKVSDQFKIRNGDILMALSGATTGKIGVANAKDEGSYLNQRVAIIRGKSKESADYIKYVLSGQYLDELLLSAGGAAQANLSPKNLAEMPIPLPPLEEQKRIAAILDKADAIRRKRRQTIDLTDQLLRSVFLDMFGDPVTNPKRWPSYMLKDVIELDNGRAFKSSEWGVAGLPIIRIQNLKNADAECNYYDGIYDQKHYVEKGDLLLSWSGQIVSFGAFIWDREPGLLNQHIFNVRPKDGRFDRLFLRFVMNSIIEVARNNFNGIEMKHLTKSELNKYLIIDPGAVMQTKFASIFKKVVEKSDLMKGSKIKLDELFSSITQKAFHGELSKQTEAA